MEINSIRDQLRAILSGRVLSELNISELRALGEIGELCEEKVTQRKGASMIFSEGGFSVQGPPPSIADFEETGRVDLAGFEERLFSTLAELRRVASSQGGASLAGVAFSTFWGFLAPQARGWLVRAPSGSGDSTSRRFIDSLADSRVGGVELTGQALELAHMVTKTSSDAPLFAAHFRAGGARQAMVFSAETGAMNYLRAMVGGFVFEGMLKGAAEFFEIVSRCESNETIRDTMMALERSIACCGLYLFARMAEMQGKPLPIGALSGSLLSGSLIIAPGVAEPGSPSKKQSGAQPQIVVSGAPGGSSPEIHELEKRITRVAATLTGLVELSTLQLASQSREVCLLRFSPAGRFLGCAGNVEAFAELLDSRRLAAGDAFGALKFPLLGRMVRETLDSPGSIVTEPFGKRSAFFGGVIVEAMADRPFGLPGGFGLTFCIRKPGVKVSEASGPGVLKRSTGSVGHMESSMSECSKDLSMPRSTIDASAPVASGPNRLSIGPSAETPDFDRIISRQRTDELIRSLRFQIEERLRRAESMANFGGSTDEFGQLLPELESTILAEYIKPRVFHKASTLLIRTRSKSSDIGPQSLSDLSAPSPSSRMKPQLSLAPFETISVVLLDDYNSADFLGRDKQFLFSAAWSMMKHLGLLERFSIPAEALRAYLHQLHFLYERTANPYHNFTHAITVMHGVYWMLRKTRVVSLFDDVAILAVVFAALVHDVDHRGKTNNFEVKKMSDLGLLYNNKSVLENHHCATAFTLLLEDSRNIFKCLHPQEFLKMRELTIEFILTTDLACHFSHHKKLKATIEKHSLSNFSISSSQERFVLLAGLLLHAADISVPTRPVEQSQIWAAKVRQEFINQFDEEVKLGLPITPYFKDLKNWASSCANEISFISNIAKPLYEDLNALLQGDLAVPLKNLELNLQNWIDLLEKEKEQEKIQTSQI